MKLCMKLETGIKSNALLTDDHVVIVVHPGFESVRVGAFDRN